MIAALLWLTSAYFLCKYDTQLVEDKEDFDISKDILIKRDRGFGFFTAVCSNVALNKRLLLRVYRYIKIYMCAVCGRDCVSII